MSNVLPTSTGATPFAYRPDLDGLRAVAVLAVVLFHYLPTSAPGGFTGVDVFFVVSGFLITAISMRRLQRGTLSLQDFYARRFRRLLPALVVVLVVCGLAGRAWFSTIEQAHLGASTAAAALFSANIYFFASTDYFAAPVETRPLLHLWSLGVEEQFYFVAPLVLMALASRQKTLFRVLVGVVVVSFAASAVATALHPSAAFYLPVFRAWELSLGAVLALVPMPSLPLRRTLAPLGLLALLASFLLLDESTHFPGVAAALPTLGTAALLVAGPDTSVGRLLSLRPLRAVGRWSYSWYLWHWPALTFATFWLLRPPTAIEALGLAVATLALSAASTRWIEAPFRRHAADRPHFVLTVGILILAAFAISGASTWSAQRPEAHLVLHHSVPATLAAPAHLCSEATNEGTQMVICHVGPVPPAADIVVWGDSHVEPLARPLHAELTALDRTALVVVRYDCPPILGVDRADVYAEHHCGEHNDKVYAHLQQNPPEVVVLHARWPLYASQSRYGDVGTVPKLVWAGSRDRPADLALALRSTIDQLEALGSRVVLVGSVPEARFHVTSTYGRAERLGREKPPGPTRAEFEARRAEAKALLERVARPSAVQLLQPAEVLCTTEACPVERDGILLYRDNNHLTEEGARPVAKALAPYLR